MKKKLLIVGASVLQQPAVIRAKELGYCVAVADFNPNAIAIKDADKYYNVSTIDKEGIYRAAEDFMADGITTLATDMPMRAVAYACKRLGLDGITEHTALLATDKGEMIRAFEEHNVDHPWYYILHGKDRFSEVLNSITYPCIIKPTDNSGSRGVLLATDKDDLEKKYNYSVNNSRGGSVIIEEYMEGPEVSVEIIVTDGTPHVLAVTDKLTTGAPHFVEMGHTQPCALEEENVEKIKDLAFRAVMAVGIYAGPAHVEIILTDKGPKMVELGARMGGDCITTHLVPLSTGIDMIEATIRIACGEKPDITSKFIKGAAIRYFRAPFGTIKNITGLDEAYGTYGVKEITFVKKIGEAVSDISSSSDRIGYVIAQANNASDAISICEKVIKKIKIEI